MYRVSFSLFGACLLFCGIAAFATDCPNDPARPTIATADASVKTAEGAEPATATADAANPPANVEAASIKFTFEERIRNEDWNNIGISIARMTTNAAKCAIVRVLGSNTAVPPWISLSVSMMSSIRSMH